MNQPLNSWVSCLPSICSSQRSRSVWLIFKQRDNPHLIHKYSFFLAQSKQVENFFMNISWYKMTKHGHEMWISCLYLWLVISSQNSSSTYPLFRWGLWMTCQRTHGMRVTWSKQDIPWHNLIHYSILPGMLKIPIIVRASGYSVPLSLLPWTSNLLNSQSTRESELGFLDTKYVVSFETISNSPNTHWMCNNTI